MLAHKGGKLPQIFRRGLLRFSQDDIPLAHGDLRQHFSGRIVGNGKIGARIPITLAALGIMLDHPSGPHSGQRKSLREIMDHGGVGQAGSRSCRLSVIDRVHDLIADQLDPPR